MTSVMANSGVEDVPKHSCLEEQDTHQAVLHIDEDIKRTVSNYFMDVEDKFYNRRWHECANEFSEWVINQLQIERQGWTTKMKMAMHEIDTKHKDILKAQTLFSNLSDQLKHILLDKCVLDENTIIFNEKSVEKSVSRYIQNIEEVITSMMGERKACLELLNIKELNDTSLEKPTKTTLFKIQEHLEKKSLESGALRNQLEYENFELRTEIEKLKKLIKSKQQEMEKLQSEIITLQNQFNGSTLLNPVTVSKPIHMDNNKNQTKQNSTGTFVKADKAVATDFAKTISKSTNTSAISSKKWRAVEPQAIEISDETLKSLKIRAKYLGNSLQNALNRMEDFTPRNTYPINDNRNRFGFKSISDYDDLAIKITPGDLMLDFNVKSLEQSKKFSLSDSSLNIATEQVQRKGAKKLPATTRAVQVHDTLSVRSSGTMQYSDKRSEDGMSQRHSEPGRFKSFKSSRAKGQVSKCLRCHRLFRTSDNHKMSCCYHPQDKERNEVYDNSGKLKRVTFRWQCCKNGLENPGCSFGHHI